MRVTRRRFGAIAGGTIASLAFGRCARAGAGAAADGRLTARPRSNVTTTGEARRALGFARGRDGIIQLPPKPAAGPLPLLVLLHGATGSAEGILRRVGAAAGEAGIAVLATDSRDTTWDAIRDGFGADVAFLDRALAKVFETVDVDPARLAIGGFSDGASYAVSLGLINGDLFPRVVGFSTGFVIDGPDHGKPRFFLSHGTHDEILPIDQCGRPVAARLRRGGYDVTFKEFDGGHEVPPAIAREAFAWATA